ncbi:MAG: DUF5103 domain-containing protein [Bacteroidota bacterium]|nr:DUF5103 domain-containing protein [Bacteroidota bacterium]
MLFIKFSGLRAIHTYFICILIALSSSLVVFSQDTEDQDYFKELFIRNEDFIYKPNIKTVLLYKAGWEMSQPIIQLNTDDKMILTFDDLDADDKYFGYTIIHCNANWQESELKQNEYIDGYYEDEIWDYAYSYNTTKAYTNYRIELPTDYLRLTKSGNYILRVYEDENTDENVIFTRRFMVLDPKVSVAARVNPTSNVADRQTKQAVDFTIYKNNYLIPFPFEKLKVVITQNRRWDNAITDLKPRLVSYDKISYDYDEGNVFDGGNEFRHFDIKSTIYQTENMKNKFYDATGYHVFLLPDERRTFDRYTFQEDLNGKLYIEAENAGDANIEGDYIFIHFKFPYEVPLVNGNLYIMGALTNWQFTEEGRLTYNFQEKAYETIMYLKQGYYNYVYVFLEDGYPGADVTLMEGSHWDTENDYTIFVYHREEGTYYDQLIGLQFLNSLYKD